MIKVTDKEYSMDDRLANNLKDFVGDVMRHWDLMLINDGVERSGKSTMAFAQAMFIHYILRTKYKIDNPLTIKNLVFTADQFVEACQDAEPYSVIIWDEAIFGAYSADATKAINKTIKKMMVTIGKRKLIIILNIPWIFILDKYLAIARSKALIHVYTPDGRRRGWFEFYNYVEKQFLYMKNKKLYTYGGTHNSFRGTFPKLREDILFFSTEEYETKKDEAIRSLTANEENTDNYRNDCIVRASELIIHSTALSLTHQQIADIFKLSQQRVSQLLTNNKSIII